jgi:hypothetical protein
VTKHSSSTNQSSVPEQLKQAFLDENLPKNLERIARKFVAKVEKRFVGGEGTTGNTTDFADKVARLKKEGATEEIKKLFLSPEFFSRNAWSQLTSQEKLRIIATGLKVVGPLIVPPKTTRAANKPTQTIEVQPGKFRDNNPQNYVVARKNNTTDNYSPSGAHTVEAESKVNLSAAENSDQNLKGKAAIDLKIYNSLRIGIEQSKLFDLRFRSVINQKGVSSLLDLANLSADELNSHLSAGLLDRKRFHHILDSARSEDGKLIYRLASILIAPLGQETGGLCLSDETVKRLSQIKVPTSQWYDNNHFDIDSRGREVPINNGFRLLRHYSPKEMSFITNAELAAIGKIFKPHLT